MMHWLLLLASVTFVNAARILVVPFYNGSHMNEMDGIARKLLERKHEMYVLVDDHTQIPATIHPEYKKVTYRTTQGLGDYPKDSDAQKMFFELTKSGSLDLHTFVLGITKPICTDMMSDDRLFPSLQALNFDLLLVDNFVLPCHFLVPFKLQKPFVLVGTTLSAWLSRLPVLASVVDPFVNLEELGIPFCSNWNDHVPPAASFAGRVCRLVAQVKEELFFGRLESQYLRQFVDFPSIEEIRANASLTLINRHYLLSSALPELPHVLHIGGVTTRPAKPISGELAKWMASVGDVVLVTFGSRFDTLPTAVVEKMLAAFARTPYRFLLRLSKAGYDGSVPVPLNVRLSDWVPQNDVLGHNHTKLFVTHSGNNGILEALYHGVPMLCFYVHADQKNNAYQVAKRGFGLTMNMFDFTIETLVDNLKLLVRNASFSDRIKAASRVFHSEKHPSLRAADAIEHVLKHGSDHLRPNEAYQLTWWQFYMLDILTLVYITSFLAVLAAIKLAKTLIKCLIRASKSLSKPHQD